MQQNNFIDAVINAKKSKSYINYKNYHYNNILALTKVSRSELLHSNFIAWLLDDFSGIVNNHEQMYLFIRMIYKVLVDSTNDSAKKWIDKDTLLKFFNSDFINCINIKREYENIDILIEIETKDKVLPIIIENKVNSKENGKNKDQTIMYFNKCEAEYSDKSKYYKVIYLILSPDYNDCNVKQNKFLPFSYQNLVDYVIEPVMSLCKNDIIKNNIKIYLQSLSFQKDYGKGGQIMAIPNKEKQILKEFINENKELLYNALMLYKEDADISEEVKNQIATTANTIKDGLPKFKFKNEEYGVGRLVLEVVKDYVNKNSNITFDELEKVFPKKLMDGKYGVVAKENAVTKKYIEGSHKRYFAKDEDKIHLKDGTVVLVSNQWTIELTTNFIKEIKKNINDRDYINIRGL